MLFTNKSKNDNTQKYEQMFEHFNSLTTLSTEQILQCECTFMNVEPAKGNRNIAKGFRGLTVGHSLVVDKNSLCRDVPYMGFVNMMNELCEMRGDAPIHILILRDKVVISVLTEEED